MDFKTVKGYFTFTATQRSGIFLLLLIIVFFQVLIFAVDFSFEEKPNSEKEQWLSYQAEIDLLKQESQSQKKKIYPFNPNFITDYKGYQLGMSVAEIDRLLEFRKINKYVNSTEEFQKVTGVSDSLLAEIAPFFKFPDWVKNKKTNSYKSPEKVFSEKKEIVLIDINQATSQDLEKVYGIGPVLAQRILTQREKLGGFVDMSQMKDIWGLSDEVIANLNKNFKVMVPPKLNKIKVNSASIRELSQFSYFKYALAKEIVLYRSMNGDIKSEEDLSKINGFPVDKVKVIALYLDF